MITATLKRKTKNLDGLINKINNLKKAKIETGYLDSSLHYSGETYAELMAWYEYGEITFNGIPMIYPVRAITINKHKRNAAKKKELKNTLVDYLFKGESLNSILNDVGQQFTETAQSIFNNTSELPVYSNPTPLFETGDLRDNWKYTVTYS